MRTLNPTKYERPREFLVALLNAKKEEDPSFSLRRWASKLGYNSPSYLSEMLRGKRRIKPAVIQKICNQEKIFGNERKHLELSVFLDNASSKEEKEFLQEQICKISGVSSKQHLSLERFRLVAEWYHWAILEMAGTKLPMDDLKAIQSRLRFPISLATIKLAIDRLIRLRLLVETPEGLKKRSADLFAGDGIPSDAIRQHHLQFLQLAEKSIELPVNERHFSGTNIAIRSEDYEKLEKLVEQFHEGLYQLTSVGEADMVYRINTQIFPLTQNKETKEERK